MTRAEKAILLVGWLGFLAYVAIWLVLLRTELGW